MAATVLSTNEQQVENARKADEAKAKAAAKQPKPPANKEAEPKPTETKAQRFVRLAQARMTAAIVRIGYLSNLANRSSYEYTAEQVDRMIVTLTDAVGKVKASFAGSADKPKSFTF